MVENLAFGIVKIVQQNSDNEARHLQIPVIKQRQLLRTQTKLSISLRKN